jgi:DUF2075 family protein
MLLLEKWLGIQASHQAPNTKQLQGVEYVASIYGVDGFLNFKL